MKKYLLGVFLIILLSGSAKALAATTSVNPGILPDSKWYFLDKFGEWIDSLFTFGAKNKAELAVHQAQERAAEIQALLQKDPTATSALDDTLTRLAEAKDAAKNAVNKVSDLTEKSDLAKETDQKFNEVEQEVNESLGQQIKALIENFKPVKEGLQEQIKLAQKSGDKKQAADLRDQLVAKEAGLRDQIHALQQKFDETQQQMDDDQKVLDDSLDEQDKSEAAKEDAELQKKQAEQAAETAKEQLEMLNEQSKDLQDHLRLDHPNDDSSHDLKDLEQEKQDLEKEVKD